MKIIGKNGAPVRTIDRIEGDRIKLTKRTARMVTATITTISTEKLVGAVEGDIINCLSTPMLFQSRRSAEPRRAPPRLLYTFCSPSCA